MWDPKAFEGATHVSQPERDALDHVKEWGLVDVFRERYHEAGIYSCWDYRAGNFHKRTGHAHRLPPVVDPALAERLDGST